MTHKQAQPREDKNFRMGEVDILVAYQGKPGPKQPNLKSISEPEVLFPVERPYES